MLVRPILTLALAMSVGACQIATAQPDQGIEARAAFEAFVEDINSGRIESAANFYDRSPGFHWVERGAVQYASGEEAAASLISNSSPGSDARMVLHEVRVAPMGEDAAIVSAHYTYSGGGSAEGQGYSFSGWMTVGMVRREDGWRLAAGQSGPAPTPANARQ